MRQPPAWRLVPTETQQSFRTINLLGDAVWLLGEGAIHQRRPDGGWAAPIVIAGDRWMDMVVAGPQLIFGITEGEAVVQQWRAGVVTALGKTGSCASIDSRMSAFGETIAASCPYYYGLVFWERGPIHNFAEMGAMAPRALVLIGEYDAVFLDGTGIHRMRASAKRPTKIVDIPERHSLLWATRNNIISASRAGEFAHWGWDPATGVAGPVTLLRAPTNVTINALWGLNADDVYAVGADGVVLNYDGRSWRVLTVPTKVRLSCMAGAFGTLWIAGDRGTLLKYGR